MRRHHRRPILSPALSTAAKFDVTASTGEGPRSAEHVWYAKYGSAVSIDFFLFLFCAMYATKTCEILPKEIFLLHRQYKKNCKKTKKCVYSSKKRYHFPRTIMPNPVVEAVETQKVYVPFYFPVFVFSCQWKIKKKRKESECPLPIKSLRHTNDSEVGVKT